MVDTLICEQCTKTNNHCCKADIPLDVPIALALIHYGEQAGITGLVVRDHPKFQNQVVILEEGFRGNISHKTCCFLKDGKCAIYQNRPDICRIYGSNIMRCRYEACGITTVSKIDYTEEELLMLDKKAFESSKIMKYIDRLR